jgi:hypothetical protein
MVVVVGAGGVIASFILGALRQEAPHLGEERVVSAALLLPLSLCLPLSPLSSLSYLRLLSPSLLLIFLASSSSLTVQLRLSQSLTLAFTRLLTYTAHDRAHSRQPDLTAARGAYPRSLALTLDLVRCPSSLVFLWRLWLYSLFIVMATAAPAATDFVY